MLMSGGPGVRIVSSAIATAGGRKVGVRLPGQRLRAGHLRCGRPDGPLALWRHDAPQDPLDHYIEVPVHGGVAVSADVEALVLDPSSGDSGLDTMARAAGLSVEWHPGTSRTPMLWHCLARLGRRPPGSI